MSFHIVDPFDPRKYNVFIHDDGSVGVIRPIPELDMVLAGVMDCEGCPTAEQVKSMALIARTAVKFNATCVFTFGSGLCPYQ